MAERIDLNARGIKVFAGRFYNHDFLWFSSFEISKTAATLPLIHNYALSFAVSNWSHGIYVGSKPRYSEDLENMAVYATPARPLGLVSRTRLTQNAVNSRSLRTDDAPKGRNSPSIGWRLVLDPVWAVLNNDSGPAGFSFYLFVRAEYNLPSIIRLGKKGCPVRLSCQEIKPALAMFAEKTTRPTHAVNPLDVHGEIVSYETVMMPPHLIFRIAEIRNDWFVYSNDHVVHVPSRLGLSNKADLPHSQ